ncbi:GrpB family protein [Rummeliibacillus sp. NPDC094406]|uniref:GrpB family protein n=1 Tax=Rummeliibacillus sp. NPDC094406 TaxID=3364511 RepID=UPI0037F27F45
MKLGLGKNEVKIVPYEIEWKDEFTRVKKEILLHTNVNENQIEHIGNTAIVEMPSKPIIDILMGVNDLKVLNEELIKGLKESGFLRLRVERPNEIVFAKFTDDTYEVKTHFIHLVEYNGELWNNLIFFRDYLNEHEDVSKEYLNIKLAYINKKSIGINAYTDFKEKFVRNIFAKRIGE